MKSYIAPGYVPMVVTTNDLIIAAIALGFTIGFGFLTTWHAIKQTVAVYRRYGSTKLNSPYIWMVWGEIVASMVFAIICWLYLTGTIPPSLMFFFAILTSWSLQVQFLLQIIINRISLLMNKPRHALSLKIGVAVLITCINIAVYNIWIPARLQISIRYEEINNVFDRAEKIFFLFVDASLNWFFIRTVRKSLVRQGLTKYNRLVRFNQCIVGLSLSMDCLIIGMMSLKNSFVYLQIHPLAYIVKLNIEMSMAELLAKISNATDNESSHFLAPASDAMPQMNIIDAQLKSFGVSQDVSWRATQEEGGGQDIMLNAQQEVSVKVERRKSFSGSFSWKEEIGGSELELIRRGGGSGSGDDDLRPLWEDDRRREERERKGPTSQFMAGMEDGMGVFTNIWVSPNNNLQEAESSSSSVSRRHIQA